MKMATLFYLVLIIVGCKHSKQTRIQSVHQNLYCDSLHIVDESYWLRWQNDDYISCNCQRKLLLEAYDIPSMFRHCHIDTLYKYLSFPDFVNTKEQYGIYYIYECDSACNIGTPKWFIQFDYDSDGIIWLIWEGKKDGG